jgi:uncharacterized membrane protein YdjX (TVP38/TMEM64 family)
MGPACDVDIAKKGVPRLAERLYAFAQSWETLGFVGLCFLALVFALGSLSFMPRFTFYSISGLIFGLAAIPAAIIGSTIGATLAFLLARTALRGAFQRMADRRPGWRPTLAAVDAEGWRVVALTRLASPLPGGAINYLYGLTGIALGPYVLATAAGLAVPITLFAGLGALGRIALRDQPWEQTAAFAAGLVVLAIAVLLVVRRRRAALRAQHR